jgi:hypothetical protein
VVLPLRTNSTTRIPSIVKATPRSRFRAMRQGEGQLKTSIFPHYHPIPRPHVPDSTFPPPSTEVFSDKPCIPSALYRKRSDRSGEAHHDLPLLKADVSAREAPIDVGVSRLETHWTTVYKTASGLIKTGSVRTHT